LDKKLNLALVGFGRFGKTYFKTIKKDKKLLLKAIFRKRKIRNSEFKLLSKKNLKENNIKAAVVCTPVKTHFLISKFLIENNIPLILEKPATNKLNEIKKLIQISSKHKAVVFVNHSDLYNENFHFLLSKKKLIGKIKYLEAKFGKYDEKYKNRNELPFKDWLPHPFALILKLVHNIQSLKIEINKVKKRKKSYFQKLVITFKSKNKIEGKITYSNNPRKKNRNLIIHGEKGKIVYDGYSQKNNYLIAKKTIKSPNVKNTPMQTILNKLRDFSKKKDSYSDLYISLKIQKLLLKIDKMI
tara:strand:- start:835 stop:1731 length:897 start_codon:yes stop_codon:yes gene_type:complete